MKSRTRAPSTKCKVCSDEKSKCPSIKIKGPPRSQARRIICCLAAEQCSTLWDLIDPGPQHANLPCPSLSPGICSNSCLLSRWCHPTISSSVTRFSSCLWSFSASGSFPMCQLFTSDDQSIGASALASVLPVNIQGWFPLGFIRLISLLFKRLIRIFFSTTIWKHQFFGAQLSLWSNSHIRTWLLQKP